MDHCKKIIASTQGHPGTRNDKTIVKFDGFVTSINNGDLYGDVPYSLTAEDGKEISLKGLYLIVDGGYHKWRCLQCPMKHTSKFKDGLWSKWVKSVRKDVECVFGILKGRFRCFKLPTFYQNKSVIDNMFFTCCILQNILLNVDGYDIRWEKDVKWLGQSGKHHNEDMAFFKKHLRRVKNIEGSTDYALQGVRAVRDRYEIFHEGAEEIEDSHFTLRGKLVDHFIRKYTKREIEWLIQNT